MEERLRVGLLNDSFPPTIDGVAQVMKNYASILQRDFCDVTVATPAYKGVRDEYPFSVVRYPSIPVGKKIGYRVGNCFAPSVVRELRGRNLQLLHVHAPFISSTLAAVANPGHRAPVVLTYHTKFEIDIRKSAGNIPLGVPVSTAYVRHNLYAADEVWTVSSGCEASLRAMGYDGPFRVMENGTDFPPGRSPQAEIDALREKYAIRPEDFVFLFVGRMRWYKNLRMVLDALRILRAQGMPVRAFMIGDGYDLPAIREYAAQIGMANQVTFTGPIRDRAYLRVFYCLADLFLFPSTYDTCGIVVKEAAAVGCPSLMIRGSCAAEGAIDGENAYLCEENAQDCVATLLRVCADRAGIAAVGQKANQTLYLSWDEAVARAYGRYREIIEGWNGPRQRKDGD